MKYFKYIPIVFFIFLINSGCEIENSPVELLFMKSSDSIAFSGDTVKFYCQVQDGDGDKISYSWESSGGDISVKKDTAYWIAPIQSGIYNITCKVSDGVGSSDARTLSVQVSPLTPVPVSGLEWTLTDSGLLGGSNSSNEDNTGISDYWDGSVENANFGWNVTIQDAPNREITQSLQFKVEDSADCGGDNPNTQSGTAVANIQVNGSSAIILELEFSGIGEAQSAGYDLIKFQLDGDVIGDGQAPGGGLGCTSDSVTVNPAAPQTLEPGPHTLTIDFTTNDGLYHVGAYYEIKLKLIVTP